MGMRLFLWKLGIQNLCLPLLLFTHHLSAVVSFFANTSFSAAQVFISEFCFHFHCHLNLSPLASFARRSLFTSWLGSILLPVPTCSPTWFSVPQPVFLRLYLYFYPLSPFSSLPSPEPFSCLSETPLAVPVAAVGESSITAIAALLLPGTAFAVLPAASWSWLELQGPSQVCVAASASRELLPCRFCRCNLTWADE